MYFSKIKKRAGLGVFAFGVGICTLIGCQTGADDALPAGDPVPGAQGEQGEPGPQGASPFTLVGTDAVYDQGNVGIGTATPAERLHVVGNARVDGTVFADAFSSNSPLRLQTAGTTRIFVDDTTGAVGIGTQTPSGMLHVDGAIIAFEPGKAGLVISPNTNYVGLNVKTGCLTSTKMRISASLIEFVNVDLAIRRTTADHPIHVGNNAANGNGAYLSMGGNWINTSDRNTKKNFKPIDARAILTKLTKMPITRWQYKNNKDSVFHIGPMAQDFRAAFGLGESDKHIGTLDADGVALAAICGLNDIVKEKQQQVTALEAENERQQKSIAAMDARLAQLEAAVGRLTKTQGKPTAVK